MTKETGRKIFRLAFIILLGLIIASIIIFGLIGLYLLIADFFYNGYF